MDPYQPSTLTGPPSGASPNASPMRRIRGLSRGSRALVWWNWLENERISRTEVAPLSLTAFGVTARAAFPVTPRGLSFIADQARGDALNFKIEIVALLRVRRSAEGGGLVRPQIPIGEWAFVVTDWAEMPFSIPRSVWFASVVSPIAGSSFVSVDIEMTRDAAAGLAQSFARLQDAERAYAVGG